MASTAKPVHQALVPPAPTADLVGETTISNLSNTAELGDAVAGVMHISVNVASYVAFGTTGAVADPNVAGNRWPLEAFVNYKFDLPADTKFIVRGASATGNVFYYRDPADRILEAPRYVA